MNLERILVIAESNTKSSINLEKLFAKSVTTTNEIETQKIRAKIDLLEARKKTYSAIKQSQEDQEKKGGVLDKILGTLGFAGLARGLKGAKPPTGGTGVVSPKPRPGGPRIGRGVPGLNVLFGGVDFIQRRSAGQSNLQAGIGAGAGVAGGMAGAALGAKIGASLGTLIAPGLGTAIGGGLGTLVGGGIGAMAAGNIADRTTGVDAGEVEIQRRIQEEEKKTRASIIKTPFSSALDTFNAALDKLSSFPGGICACAGRIEEVGSAVISVPKDKLQEAYNVGYAKGIKDGGTAGGAAGFVAGVALVGGILFLTRGKGGPLIQRIGAIADLVPKAAKAAKTDPSKIRILSKEKVPTPTSSSLRTILDPSKVRVIPKEEVPTLPLSPLRTILDPSKVRVIPKKENILPTQNPTKTSISPNKIRSTSTPQEKPTTQRIIESVFNESPAPKSAPKIPRDLKTGRSQELIEEIIDTPEGQVIIRRPASKAEKTTPEEFFQKQELKGIKNQIKKLKKIRKTLEPEEVSPVGPQSSIGGSNVVTLAEPNTTIVPVPVGGGTQVISSTGATPYQAAAKYAQMMSQITV
jgi:hypothetical protein